MNNVAYIITKKRLLLAGKCMKYHFKKETELFCRLFLHILAICEQNIIIHILNPFNLDERLIKETVVSHNVGSFYFLNNMLNLARRKEASRNTHAITTAPYLLSIIFDGRNTIRMSHTN